jgi:hypothetical protein
VGEGKTISVGVEVATEMLEVKNIIERNAMNCFALIHPLEGTAQQCSFIRTNFAWDMGIGVSWRDTTAGMLMGCQGCSTAIMGQISLEEIENPDKDRLGAASSPSQ